MSSLAGAFKENGCGVSGSKKGLERRRANGDAYDSLEGKGLTCPRQYRVTEEGRGFPEIQRLRSYRYITCLLILEWP